MKYTKNPMMIRLLVTMTCGCSIVQGEPQLTTFEIVNDKVEIDIDGPAGEYKVECSDDLQSNHWTQLSRQASDGSTQAFDDPFDGTATMKFYRIFAVPSADELHLSGDFAAALESGLPYSDLQSTFGFNFPEGEAVIPAGNDLSYSTRNARIYAAVIAALSKLAKDVSDSFEVGSQPSATDIASAFASDISDGKLDGNNNGAAVPIGATGTFLPAYTEQDFENALNEVKAGIPGLYNVYFTGSGAAAAPPIGGFSIFSVGNPGTFAPAIPAKWGDFYWGSSDWQ